MTFELRNVSTNCAVGLGTVINGERSLMPGKKVDVITMEDMEKARKIVANFRHLLTLTAVIEPVVETSSVEDEETVAPAPKPVEDGTEVTVEETESGEEVIADPDPETGPESVEDGPEVAAEETAEGEGSDDVKSTEESDGAISDPAPVTKKKRGRKPRRSEG